MGSVLITHYLFSLLTSIIAQITVHIFRLEHQTLSIEQIAAYQGISSHLMDFITKGYQLELILIICAFLIAQLFNYRNKQFSWISCGIFFVVFAVFAHAPLNHLLDLYDRFHPVYVFLEHLF